MIFSKKVECHCSECGKTFQRFPSLLATSKSGKQFCSNPCRAAYFAKDKSRNDLKCSHCGKTFSRSLSEIAKSSQDNIYCSRECYDEARKLIVETRNRPVGRRGKHPVQCHHCGKTIYLKPSVLNSRQAHFCSRECKRLGSITTGRSVPLSYIKKTQAMVCAICGIDDPDVLEVHHKDHDRSNNTLDNLIVLCANCHARAHRGKLKMREW